MRRTATIAIAETADEDARDISETVWPILTKFCMMKLPMTERVQ